MSRSRLGLVLVVLLGLLAFAPSLGNGFCFDDSLAQSRTSLQLDDPVIRESHPPWFYFATPYWAGEQRQSRLYRPVTIWSYALTYHWLSKPLLPPQWEALPHHLINLLLNCLAVGLVLWLMLDLQVCRSGAMLTAAMFAVHAVHSEVVAGIVGRAELFAFVFGALMLWLWRRVEAGAHWLWLLLAGLSWFAALGSKESAVGWLALVPCYLLARRWLTGNTTPLAGTALRLGLVLGVPLLGFLLLRGIVVADQETEVYYAANALYHEDSAVRLLTATKLYGYGIYKCVAPFSLACLYSPLAVTLVDTPLDPGFLLALSVILAWLAVGLWRPWRRPRLFLSVVVFFGFSFVTSNIPFAIGTIFGERLYFVPSLALCILPALWLPQLGALGRRWLVSTCVVWMLACLVVDFQRSLVWRSNQTLMLNDVVAQPRCVSLQVKAATMHHVLSRQAGLAGDAAGAERHLDLAWQHLRTAQQLDPDYVDARATEATFLRFADQQVEADGMARQVLAMRRLPISGLEAAVRGNLGLSLARRGERAAAVAELRLAVELQPTTLQWRFGLLEHGIGLLPPDVAKAVLIEALQRYPDNVLPLLFQADFIHSYAEIDRGNAEAAAGLLATVFRSLQGEAAKHRRYAKGRLQQADFQAALGRHDAARRNYQRVIDHPEATPQCRAKAETALQSLPK